MYKIVLLRHGESLWNKENRFTGWTDIDLSPEGIKEAKEAGQILKKEGYSFDLVFTSVLKRAIQTTEIVLREMDLESIEKRLAWQLNERHYGALQGMDKAKMAQEYGEEQVHIWRRSYSVRPPELTICDFEKQNQLEIFKSIPIEKLPKTESLRDTYDRTIYYWKSNVVPEIKNERKILVSAHGNSLRAVVKYLDNISDNEISNLNIPTGVPLVYELDENLSPIKHYFLGDPKEIEAKIEKVKNQGKK